MSYDAIVIGTGGIGSSALYHLARRGLRVLGLDRFPPGHDRGSSHGQTRIIRQAYFEHPNYVPLLRRAYELWTELESFSGEQLFHRCGLLEVGPPDGIVIPGVLESSRRYALDVDSLSADEIRRRFRGFEVPESCVGVFERDAGYLRVERCVIKSVEAAIRHGAELRLDEAVVSWSADARGVNLRTDRDEFSAATLVITAGAWACELLRDVGMALQVVRKHLHWYDSDCEHLRESAGCPAFFYEMPNGYFYGFPKLDHRGVKVAEHGGRELVGDPLAVNRAVDPVDRQRVESFLGECLPAVSRRTTDHSVCMYTLTPDEHFFVDRHPAHPHVAFAAGLSGHGFKFAPVLGEVLADLVAQGKTDLPIGFLRLAGRLPVAGL